MATHFSLAEGEEAAARAAGERDRGTVCAGERDRGSRALGEGDGRGGAGFNAGYLAGTRRVVRGAQLAPGARRQPTPDTDS